MTFAGVMYDTSERPEIIRQLPNDIDIQHEKFWWTRLYGACVCMSLLELRDAQPDQLTEGHADGYKYVCDRLGYETVGVAASEEDVLKFENTRKAVTSVHFMNDVGSGKSRGRNQIRKATHVGMLPTPEWRTKMRSLDSYFGVGRRLAFISRIYELQPHTRLERNTMVVFSEIWKR